MFDATFSFKSKLVFFLRLQAAPFPEIKSTHSLVAKHVTPEKWEKLAEHKTATSGFTLAKVRKILCYNFFGSLFLIVLRLLNLFLINHKNSLRLVEI